MLEVLKKPCNISGYTKNPEMLCGVSVPKRSLTCTLRSFLKEPDACQVIHIWKGRKMREYPRGCSMLKQNIDRHLHMNRNIIHMVHNWMFMQKIWKITMYLS